MTLAPHVEIITRLACDLVIQTESFSLIPSYPNFNITAPKYDLYHLELANSRDEVVTPQVPYERCLKEPSVQSKASKLQAGDYLPTNYCSLLLLYLALTTIMGVLSAVTTGWWGRFSERHGRLIVLSISTIGILIT
jgi:hypothetical protein